jgi:hypothetical protein
MPPAGCVPPEKLSRNSALTDYHAVKPRCDYDGASIVWCKDIETVEKRDKDFEIERAVIPSSSVMGGEASGCVCLRTDRIKGLSR